MKGCSTKKDNHTIYSPYDNSYTLTIICVKFHFVKVFFFLTKKHINDTVHPTSFSSSSTLHDSQLNKEIVCREDSC